MLKTVSTPARLAAAGLACLLARPSLPAQEAPKPKLHIVIVEGEGAVNNIRQRIAREPIVQVEDENRKPLAGATVVFLLPDSGASGVFPNGTRMLTVTTNAQGRAAATGLKPNNVAGKFQIRVSATYQGMTASASITQTNAMVPAAPGGAGAGKIIAIIAAVGAAGAGGAIAATRAGKGAETGPAQPPRRTVSISPRTPSVGAPPR